MQVAKLVEVAPDGGPLFLAEHGKRREEEDLLLLLHVGGEDLLGLEQQAARLIAVLRSQRGDLLEELTHHVVLAPHDGRRAGHAVALHHGEEGVLLLDEVALGALQHRHERGHGLAHLRGGLRRALRQEHGSRGANGVQERVMLGVHDGNRVARGQFRPAAPRVVHEHVQVHAAEAAHAFLRHPRRNRGLLGSGDLDRGHLCRNGLELSRQLGTVGILPVERLDDFGELGYCGVVHGNLR